MANKLKITWVKSVIKTKAEHRGTVRALGLHRIRDVVVKNDTPAIRGMIHQVAFLLKVEEVEG